MSPNIIYMMDVKKQLSSNTKTIAINHYLNNNITQNEIAKIFKIDVRTVKRWIKRYRDDALERKKRTTKSYKIKQKHVKFLYIKSSKRYCKYSLL